MEKEERNILLSIIIVYFCSMFFAAFSTSTSLNESWFDLLRPALVAQSNIFGALFIIVSISMCFSFYLSWKYGGEYHRKLLLYVYVHNLIFTTLWIFIYFGLGDVYLAFADSLLILASITFIMKINYSLSKTSSALMIPYITWYFILSLLSYLEIFFR